MIEFIITFLKHADFGVSKNIDIAKGANKLPENWKEFKKHLTYIKNRHGN